MKSKYDYIESNVNSKGWDLETAAQEAYIRAKRLRKKRRIPELEKWIINSAVRSADYAKFILKERWPEAENIILEKGSAKIVYPYIEKLVKQRWAEAENIILKSPEYSYKYAIHILKKRWPEAEKIILDADKKLIKNANHFYSYYSFKYAKDLVKDRWEELEEIIIDNPSALQYYAQEVLGDALPEEIHNRMICSAISSNDFISLSGKKYLEFAKEAREDFVKKLKRFDSNLTIKEVIQICEKN